MSRRGSARRAALFGMAAAMVFAGAAHWVMPTPFVQHLPPWVPFAEALVLTTGVLEVGLGAALLLRQPWRRRAGLALAAYFVAVFPANVRSEEHTSELQSRQYLVCRLLLEKKKNKTNVN